MIAAAKPTKGKSANSETCMVPDCTRPAKMRGVCASCYQNASKLVHRGGTTWAELEQLGIVRPPHAGPKGYRAPLYLALEAARAKAKEGEKAAKTAKHRLVGVKKGVKS